MVALLSHVASASLGAAVAMLFLMLVSSNTYKCHQSKLAAITVHDTLPINLDGFSWGTEKFFGTNYMQDRLNFTYYKSIIRLAQQYAPNAESIIDVGAPWPFVTAFNWIPQKTMLNNRYPDGMTTPDDVSLVLADFYQFSPPQKYDLVICNQVMEHVDDPAAFAQKLLEIGHTVIASVPYNWGPGTIGHVQHYIDQDQLLEWFGRKDYTELGVVQEVQRKCSTKCGRLYVVYRPPVADKDKTIPIPVVKKEVVSDAN